MSTAVMTSRALSLADLLRDLGDISPEAPDQSQRFVDGQIVQDSKILSAFSIPVSDLFNEIRETHTSS